ncbi:MAG: HEAT repeat domain-containing protein [Acidobacteriota bacterium]|nr:HEAT repeat domain-containing protein [Acidobacteriota bacterium]
MSVKTLISLLLCAAGVPLIAQPNVTAWNILTEGLHADRPEHRRQAVTAIASVGLTPESVHALEDALRNDKDADVRQTAAAELGILKSRQSIPALKDALDDPSEEVQFTAAKSLWEMDDHTGEEELGQVLTGEAKMAPGLVGGAMKDAKAKLHSPRTLAMMGVKEASGVFLGPASIGIVAAEEAMKDKGAPGRVVAASTLAQACDARVIQLFEFMLDNEKNWAVKAAVARGIGRCGSKDDIPRLEQHLSESRHAVKFMAAGAIVRLSLEKPVVASANP